ncbi:MAG: DUF494 family protein [Fusobacteria bacterium]|nr:DUF494 family protein [Fusobacteriota bacterium]
MRKKIDIDEILTEYLGEASEKCGEKEDSKEQQDKIFELLEKMNEELKVIDLSKVEAKIRVLHPFERETLSVEAREYLSELLKSYVLDGGAFEAIINRFYGQFDVTCKDIDLALHELRIPKEILYN